MTNYHYHPPDHCAYLATISEDWDPNATRKGSRDPVASNTF